MYKNHRVFPVLGIALLSFISLTNSSIVYAQQSASQASTEVRDPTAPLGHISDSTVQESRLTLNAVLVGPGRKLAVINGHNVREGQIIPGLNDIKVQRISGQTVTLRQGSKTWALTLSPSVVKKHSSIQQNN